MPVTERLALHREGLAEAHFGRSMISSAGRDQRQVVQRRGRVRVIFPARLPVHVQAYPQNRLSAREIAFQPQDGGKIAQADRRFPVLLPEHLLPDGQRFPVQGLDFMLFSSRSRMMQSRVEQRAVGAF